MSYLFALVDQATLDILAERATALGITTPDSTGTVPYAVTRDLDGRILVIFPEELLPLAPELTHAVRHLPAEYRTERTPEEDAT
jgi:hypothetical protein